MEAIFVIVGFFGLIIVGTLIFLRQRKLVQTLKTCHPEISGRLQISEQLFSQSPASTSKLLGLVLFRSGQEEISDQETNSQINTLRKFYYVYIVLFLMMVLGLLGLFSER